jgi:ABC-type multidrug transport system fused ATPase/permease subunit
MTDQTVKVREVAWSELFPWLMLFRSVRIALMARVLILGALGLILTTLGWRAIGWLFSGYETDAMQYWQANLSRWVWQHSEGFEIAMSARNADEVFQSAWHGVHEAPVELWLFLTNPFRGMFSQVPPSVFFYLLFCAIWELLVWGLIGGAITRIAALKFTRDEAPGLVAALQHAASKLPSYSLPPLVALGGAGVFAIQLVALGALMQLEVFTLLIALIWIFVLMLGLLMAFLLLGVLVGWPLMWATISVEGTDAFDALSRSYAYTYHRPWRLLWYVLVVGLLAIVSMFVVKLFAATAINLGDWSIDWGLDNPTMQRVVRQVDDRNGDVPTTIAPPSVIETQDGVPPPVAAADTATAQDTARQEDSRLQRWAKHAIFFWKSMMAALSAGYQAGFLWASAVGVYLLLRRDIDGVQTNEVYVDQDEHYGLPPLAEDAATGVPEVAINQAARSGDVANPADLPRGD